MKRKAVLVITVVVLAMAAGFAGADTVTIYPTGDSYVTPLDPGGNYGNGMLTVSYDGSNSQMAFFQFNSADFPPGIINSANFYFYSAMSSGNPVMYLEQCTGNWTEGGITYNNMPGVAGTAVTVPLNDMFAGYYNGDIKNIFEQWRAGNNYGVRMSAGTTPGFFMSIVNSRESGAGWWPYLVIDYNPLITPTLTPFVTSTLTPTITMSYTVTPTVTETFVVTATPTYTITQTSSITPTFTVTATRTVTPTDTATIPVLTIPEAVDSLALAFTHGGSANWVPQTSVYYYDGDAAQSGMITHGQTTYMQTYVTGPKLITFFWRVSSEANYDYLRFYINGVQQDAICGYTSWAQKSFYVGAGTHQLRWSYTKDYSVSSGSDCGWVDLIQLSNSTPTPSPTPIPLPEAVDNLSLTFLTGGNSTWYGQAYTYYSGNDAAQSGVITHSQNTYMQTSVTGPAELSFYWRVSSESGYDYLRFYIDGVQQASISGNYGTWYLRNHSIGGGTHTLRWAYTKDGSVNYGSDCGWVDLINIVPITPTVSATITPTFTVTPTPGIAPFPYFDGFEGGGFNGYWSTYSSTINGRIQVTTSNIPYAGNYHATMDTAITGNNLNEMILHINLAGALNPKLSFYIKEFGEEANTPAAVYTSHSNGDGVAISQDGVNWVTIMNLTGSYYSYTNQEIDLGPAMASAGFTNLSHIRIKFQQYDNYPIPTDGFSFDNIWVYSAGVYTPTPTFTATSTITQTPTISATPTPVNMSAIASFPFYDSFETGNLIPCWTTYGSNSYSRLQVTSLNIPYTGGYHVTMDSSVSPNYALNELILHINFAGAQNPRLRFFIKEFGEEPNTPAAIYTNHTNGDGVAISQDGINWVTIINLTGNYTSYTEFDMNLASAMAGAGFTNLSHIRIKFQQYDNYSIATDGFAFDDIQVYAYNTPTCTPTVTNTVPPGTPACTSTATSSATVTFAATWTFTATPTATPTQTITPTPTVTYVMPEEGDSYVKPQPASDWAVFVFVLEEDSEAELNIYNLAGMLVAQEQFGGIRGINEVTVDTRGFAPGIYFYIIKAKGSTKKEKFRVDKFLIRK